MRKQLFLESVEASRVGVMFLKKTASFLAFVVQKP